MANRGSVRSGIHHQGQQMRTKIVAAPALEFAKQRRAPVRSVIFKTVTEDGVRWLISEGRQETIADGMKVILGCGTVVVVEDKPFSAD